MLRYKGLSASLKMCEIFKTMHVFNWVFLCSNRGEDSPVFCYFTLSFNLLISLGNTNSHLQRSLLEDYHYGLSVQNLESLDSPALVFFFFFFGPWWILIRSSKIFCKFFWTNFFNITFFSQTKNRYDFINCYYDLWFT